MSNQAIDRHWNDELLRNAEGAPLIAARTALEFGPGVLLVDVRDPDTASGVLGHIQGSVFLSGADLDALALSPEREPLVLISADGETAAALATRLEAAGAKRVAALQGGLAGWRGLGYLTTRGAGALVGPQPAHDFAFDGQMTADVLRDELARPRSVNWVQMAALQFHASQSCVDGRDGRSVVGTPGGDAGEFALLLAAIEKVEGIQLDDGAVEAALVAHMDAFGDFYMHTDTHAIEHLYGQLRADPQASGSTPEPEAVEAWTALLNSPPAAVREPLLRYLTEPENIGCGHLRLSIQHARDYGVRAELVQSVLRAFFRLLWRGAREPRMVILEGGHAESAVLSIGIEETADAFTPVPVATPAYYDSQVFVNHPDVARYWRKMHLAFHASKESPLPVSAGKLEELGRVVDELGDAQMGVTLSHLAKGLPIFQARLHPGGGADVEQIG